LVTVILLGASGLLQWINPDMADTLYYFALVFALVFGTLHTKFMYRYLPVGTPDEFWKGFIIGILLIILAAITISLAYHFLNLNYSFISFLSAFILPYLIWQAYRNFLLIPRPVYSLWYYPVNESMPDLDMIDLSQIEVIQFVFFKKVSDTDQTRFTSKAPLNMTLGQLFFIFIIDYNEKNPLSSITFLNDQQLPYGWLFFRKKKWPGRNYYFDPSLTFRNNFIKANESIYAVRMNG
jgi:hypothetical protein